MEPNPPNLPSYEASQSGSKSPVNRVISSQPVKNTTPEPINPNAFEEVMSREEEARGPLLEPFYRHRLFIAMGCLLAGVIAGKYVADSGPSANKPNWQTSSVASPETNVPIDGGVFNQVDGAMKAAKMPDKSAVAYQIKFRELNSVEEYDPWKPLNGGFPLPPTAIQAKMVERMANAQGSSIPKPLNGEFKSFGVTASGEVVPLDPATSQQLPDIRGVKQTGNSKPVLSQKPGMVNSSTAVESSDNEVYLAIKCNADDPKAASIRASIVANSMGGSGRIFEHVVESGDVELHGAFLLFPANKLETVKDELGKLGSLESDRAQTGNLNDFQVQIQSPFVARLTQLRERRKELLVDFLDDAQPVKLIDEAIEQEGKAILATQLSRVVKTGPRAAIRLLFK